MTLAQALEPDPDDRDPDCSGRAADPDDFDPGPPRRPWPCAGEPSLQRTRRRRRAAARRHHPRRRRGDPADRAARPQGRAGLHGAGRPSPADGPAAAARPRRPRRTTMWWTACWRRPQAQQAAAIVLPTPSTPRFTSPTSSSPSAACERRRWTPRRISAALGYAELEIKRLEALSAVHPIVLKALRQGRLTLKQVRLFARLPDKEQQAEIAQTRARRLLPGLPAAPAWSTGTA